MGESALLFSLTRRAIVKSPGHEGRLPLSVYLVMGVYVALALAVLGAVAARVRRWEKTRAIKDLPRPRWQLGIWLALLALVFAAWAMSWWWVCALLLLSSQLFPHQQARK